MIRAMAVLAAMTAIGYVAREDTRDQGILGSMMVPFSIEPVRHFSHASGASLYSSGMCVLRGLGRHSV